MKCRSCFWYADRTWPNPKHLTLSGRLEWSSSSAMSALLWPSYRRPKLSLLRKSGKKKKVWYGTQMSVTQYRRIKPLSVRYSWNSESFFRGPGSVVGITTAYGLDGPGIESRWGVRFSAPVQTGHKAHPASCTMGTGSFLGVRCGRDVTLTPHPLLMPRLKIE